MEENNLSLIEDNSVYSDACGDDPVCSSLEENVSKMIINNNNNNNHQIKEEESNGNDLDSDPNNTSTDNNCTTEKINCTLDLELVCDSFQKAIEIPSEIDMFFYIQAYNELIKFFNVFGTLFTFVTKDVHSKLNILESYLNDEENGLNYRTIRTMIVFEKDQNLLTDQKRPSGSRTLLRLHRALEFMSTFLYEVTKLDDSESTVNAARGAYNQTLAKYHPWYIKKSVQLATIALPYRKNLIERVYGGTYPYNGQSNVVNENISHLASITDKVFLTVQKLYEEYDLLDLP